MDLAELAGAPVRVTLAGEDFLVPPHSLKRLGLLQGWFKREVPSPATKAAEAIDRAERQGSRLSARARDMLGDAAIRAEQAWPPKVGSLPWLVAIDDAEKLDGFVLEVLRETNPHVTPERARELARDAGKAELSALILAVLYGRTPDPIPSPKAGAPTPGPNPTTTTGRSPSGTTTGAG